MYECMNVKYECMDLDVVCGRMFGETYTRRYSYLYLISYLWLYFCPDEKYNVHAGM